MGSVEMINNDEIERKGKRNRENVFWNNKKEEIYVKRNDISIRYRVLFYVVFS